MVKNIQVAAFNLQYSFLIISLPKSKLKNLHRVS